MLTTVTQRLRAAQPDGEGAALFSVVIASVVVLMTVATIALNLQTGLLQSVTARESMTSRNAAESGADAGLASAAFGDCKPKAESEEFGYSYVIYGNDFKPQKPSAVDSFGNRRGCPQTGDLYLIVHSVGVSPKNVKTEWGDGSPEQAFDEAATTRQMPSLISRTEK